MFVNIIGLAYFFRMLLRMGLVQSSRAAPEGSLEASTEPRTQKEALQAEAEQCPICLEDFDEADTLVKMWGKDEKRTGDEVDDVFWHTKVRKEEWLYMVKPLRYFKIF